MNISDLRNVRSSWMILCAGFAALVFVACSSAESRQRDPHQLYEAQEQIVEISVGTQSPEIVVPASAQSLIVRITSPDGSSRLLSSVDFTNEAGHLRLGFQPAAGSRLTVGFVLP